MKQIFSLILLSLALVGCSSAQWTRLEQGCYIYGDFPKKGVLSWDGQVVGSLANGPGTIFIHDDEGRLLSSDKVETKLGVVAEYSFMPTPVGNYLGKKEKGLPHGFGVLISNDTLSVGTFKKGYLNKGHFEQYVISKDSLVICAYGTLKHGKTYGPAKQYDNGIITFEGSYKKGLRNGIGNEYKQGNLVYAGNWQNDERSGYGTEYNDAGVVVYQGEWRHNLYNGSGKYYAEGLCQEGKWSDGMLEKSISSSVISELKNATRHWLSSDVEDADSTVVSTLTQDIYSQSEIEFIESLNEELEAYLTEKIGPRVEKRFGFWNIIRMIFQPWLRSDVKRAELAQKYFCKKLPIEDVENWVNAKIDFYNQVHGDKLGYIKLEEAERNSIVDSDIALKIFEREAMETTDILVGILVDVLVCFVIAFIIGFLVGMFIPPLVPFLFIVDIVMTVIAFGIGLYVTIFRTTPLSIELESQIRQMVIDNYLMFMDSQNIITQILGL